MRTDRITRKGSEFPAFHGILILLLSRFAAWRRCPSNRGRRYIKASAAQARLRVETRSASNCSQMWAAWAKLDSAIEVFAIVWGSRAPANVTATRVSYKAR